MIDDIAVQGFVSFTILDRSNRAIKTFTDNNLITTVGKNYFVKKIVEDPSIAGSAIASIAVGSGTTSASVEDTSLEAETGRSQVDFISVNENIGQFLTTLPLGVAIGSISEAGLYTNDDTPLLISRIVLPTSFNKVENESIRISWRLKIGGTSTTSYIQAGYVQDGYV